MTEAVVAKPFPYWNNGTIIKFKTGETFDFPARAYRDLMKSGYIGDGKPPVVKPLVADAPPTAPTEPDEEKKPRGRKLKTERFRLGDDTGLVPELGE